MIKHNIANEIWNRKYRFKEETELDFYTRVADGLFPVKEIPSTDNTLNRRLYEAIRDHKFMTAGRGMYSIGTPKSKQTLSNCFVIPIKNDSLTAIFDALKEAGKTMQSGGGVGYSFSVLRPKGSIINTSGQESSGVVSFMRMYDTMCGTIKAGGDRRGAQIGILSISHPEVEDFISAKRDGSLSNFNLSLFITDDFMHAVEGDLDWTLVFPDTTDPTYNETWDGNYKAWRDAGKVFITYKTMKARELYDKIMKSNYNFAEPGILFEDTINNNNNLKHIEYILASNPCVTGDTMVTIKGEDGYPTVIRMDALVNRFKRGEYFEVFSYDEYTQSVEVQPVTFAEKTRENANILEFEFDNGTRVKLTPDHKVWTKERGYVEAAKLTQYDTILKINP